MCVSYNSGCTGVLGVYTLLLLTEAFCCLFQVFDIQSNITNLVVPGTLDNGTEVNVTLGDICLKPLSPDNENCATMSVLNYFQNNLTQLQYNENFGLINNSYHIHYCTRYGG